MSTRKPPQPVHEVTYVARDLAAVTQAAPPGPLVMKIAGEWREIFRTYDNLDEVMEEFGIKEGQTGQQVVTALLGIWSDQDARALVDKLDTTTQLYVGVRYLDEERSGRGDVEDAWHFFRAAEPVTVLQPIASPDNES